MFCGQSEFASGPLVKGRLDANSNRPCRWYNLWMRIKEPHRSWPMARVWSGPNVSHIYGVGNAYHIHSKLCSITHVATKAHVILRSLVVLTWMCDTIELMQDVILWKNTQYTILMVWCGVVWSTPLGFPGRCGICMHQHSTSENKNKNKKVTLHMLTHDSMRGYGSTSLVVCINDKFCDIRERTVTTRSEIWTTHIVPQGVRILENVWHYGGWYYGV
jgi:hypothetical protein